MTLMPRCWLLPRDGVLRLAPYNLSQATLAFAFVFDVAPLQANGVSMSPWASKYNFVKISTREGEQRPDADASGRCQHLKCRPVPNDAGTAVRFRGSNSRNSARCCRRGSGRSPPGVPISAA